MIKIQRFKNKHFPWSCCLLLTWYKTSLGHNFISVIISCKKVNSKVNMMTTKYCEKHIFNYMSLTICLSSPEVTTTHENENSKLWTNFLFLGTQGVKVWSVSHSHLICITVFNCTETLPHIICIVVLTFW